MPDPCRRPHSWAVIGQRFRSAATNAASTFSETISKGENPRRQASQKVIVSNAMVRTTFGQALSCHCPGQLSCSAEENGFRYEIGHWYPSGPRDPSTSSKRCRWKLTSASNPVFHFCAARANELRRPPGRMSEYGASGDRWKTKAKDDSNCGLETRG
jgi:hypothetical protein